MMKLLEDIDELLCYLEDTSHGEEGRRITEMRHRIQTELMGRQCDYAHHNSDLRCFGYCTECKGEEKIVYKSI